MNKEKITIKIADQTGFTINESDLSTGKIVVNGVEVTDTESWNKAISTFTELEYQLKEQDKEIERLNNIIDLIRNNIDITIQIIEEQPTGNDEWILERLNGIKNIGKELKEDK